MSALKVLFEDNSILVVEKPAGLMVEKDKFGNPSVEGSVESLFTQKRVSQNTIIGIVHRLDRPVSGVLLIAKKKSVLKILNEQFETGAVDKIYYALTENRPEKDEAHLQHFLKKDLKEKKAVISKNKKNNSVKCELIYKLIRTEKKYFLLEVHPLTGKYHQIRAQLAFVGCPIVGDEKYGSTKHFLADAICLHAYSIEFMHPVEKKKMKFISELPENWQIKQL